MARTRLISTKSGSGVSRRTLLKGAVAGVALGSFARPVIAQKRPMVYGYANWQDDLAVTNIGAQLLEEKYGYQVTQVQGDVAVIYASLKQGKIDAFSASYMEGLDPLKGVYNGGQAEYVKKIADAIEIVGVSVGPYTQGFVVPEYVTIDSIDELNANAGKFDNKIIGIDAGSGLFQTADKAIQEYGLKLTQVPGSEGTMFGALKRAYERKEWVVVTAVAPSPLWTLYKLKYLKDPKNIMLPKPFYDFHVVHKDFKSNYPEAYSFFQKYHPSNDDVSEVMHWIDGGASPADAAKRWISENRGKGIIEQWLS
jgi:glycine betaine/proline transport system substrate-binding protein